MSKPHDLGKFNFSPCKQHISGQITATLHRQPWSRQLKWWWFSKEIHHKKGRNIQVFPDFLKFPHVGMRFLARQPPEGHAPKISPRITDLSTCPLLEPWEGELELPKGKSWKIIHFNGCCYQTFPETNNKFAPESFPMNGCFRWIISFFGGIRPIFRIATLLWVLGSCI